MSEENTTIAVSKATQTKLRGLEEYPRETYDSIINRLIKNLKNYCEGCGDPCE